FQHSLTPGTHKILVHNRCCVDLTQDLVVTLNRPDQLYQLNLGHPLAARLKVKNAPPGAEVRINDKLVGTAAHPPDYAMDQLDLDATVTIGDRTLVIKLKAGSDNELDYAKATPKAAP